MKKSEATGLKKLIDVRTVTDTGNEIRLTATVPELQDIAKRFDIPVLHTFSVTGHLSQPDAVIFDGTIEADMEQNCVVTLERFRRCYTYPFHIVFSDRVPDTDTDWDDDIIEPIQNGKINLGTAIVDEFGSRLDPFPKKDNSFFEYHDPSDTHEEFKNPFSALKNLTIKK